MSVTNAGAEALTAAETGVKTPQTSHLKVIFFEKVDLSIQICSASVPQVHEYRLFPVVV